MPADFSEYINLRIFDKEPGDIYRDSIEVARLTLPEFNLRIGTPEDAIFQSMAYIGALNVASINRLPDRLMAGILAMMGYARQPAVPAEVDVVITFGDVNGGVIPEGTAFSYNAVFEDQVTQYAFRTTSATSVDPSEDEYTFPTVTVTLQAIDAGTIPPLDSSIELGIISSGTDIISAVTANPSNFANGINADTDEDYLSRAVTYLRGLNATLAKASQIDAYVLTRYPAIVSRAKTYDLTNGDDVETGGNITVNRVFPIENTYLDSNIATIETNAPHLYIAGDIVRIELTGASASASPIYSGEFEVEGTGDTIFTFPRIASNQASAQLTGSVFAGEDQQGYVTTFAYGYNRYLSSTEKAEIENELTLRSVAGLRFAVLDPTLVTLTIQANVAVSDEYNSDTVSDSINSALIDFLSPASFPLTNDRVRYSQIISLISSIPGVLYVGSLTLTPTGNYWLPQIGDDILFLNKGTLPVLSLGDIAITYTTVSTS